MDPRRAGLIWWWRPNFSPRVFLEGAALVALLIVAFSATRRPGSFGPSRPVSGGRCSFPAIFNFGDSNSDTGGLSAAFRRLPPPNGVTFFDKPSGRYCDGKLILDFIADKLGLPYLGAYLDSIGANFRHGANFATSASTIEPLNMRLFQGGFSPISLDIQLEQFVQFKARSLELHHEGSSYAKSSLPMPEDFARAIYTMDIGQNDLHSALGSMTKNQIMELIPNITSLFARAVEKLYQQGARALWIHNTGPIGCLPYSLFFNPPKANDIDPHGCVASHNRIAQEFNRQLKEWVSKLRLQLHDAKLNYIDVYSAKYSMISEAEKHGFFSPLTYCCGQLGGNSLECWNKATVNVTEVFGTICEDPLKVISWDSVHYTHAANEWVANRIVDGSLSDIHVPIGESCPESSAY